MSAVRSAVILFSGRGSNMAALIDAAAEADYPVRIVGVLTDNPEAPGLALAGARGLEARVVERRLYPGREAHDAAIDAELRSMNADLVALAGYMRRLTPSFVNVWSGRLVNIHPSLLPLFKGLDTHERAIAAGVRVHGCSVHFVTAEVDDGPIIAQAAVAVHATDTAAALAARVLKEEHRLYPLALRLVAEGKARLEDGRTVYSATDEIEWPDSALHVPSRQRMSVDLENLARFTP